MSRSLEFIGEGCSVVGCGLAFAFAAVPSCASSFEPFLWSVGEFWVGWRLRIHPFACREF